MDRPPIPDDPSKPDEAGVEDDDTPSNEEMESLLQGGLEAFQNKDYESCANQWERLTQFDKENYRILVFLSLAYNRMRQPELARGALIRATKIQPRYAKAWNNLGNSFRDTGELFRAIDAYEKAVRLKPKSHDYRYNLAITYLDTLQYSEAIDQFRQYRALDSEDDSILLLLASAYYQIDNPQKAFNCVRVYLQRHPKTRDFLRLRAQMKLLRTVIEERQEVTTAPTERIGSPAGDLEEQGDLAKVVDDSDELIEAAFVEPVSDDELVSVELVEPDEEAPQPVPASAPEPAPAPNVGSVVEDEDDDEYDDEIIEWVDDGLGEISSDESLDTVA